METEMTTFELDTKAIDLIKARFSQLDNLDLLHEFKNLSHAAERFASKGEEIPSEVWDSFNLAESELMKRMS